MPHSCSLILLLFIGTTGQAQITDQQRARNLPKSFHDDALNITYFYPAHFEVVTTPPDTSQDPALEQCASTTLIADSSIPAGPSSFVLSRIDDTCPELLRKAASLGPFTRAQLLRQLQQFGKPTISHEPTRYMISGRPAAITLGSVSSHAADQHAGRTIYAARACALADIPAVRHKKSEPDDARRVLCFDFSTENSDLISLMFAFVIQFDHDPPWPLFPGSVHPSYWATGGRKPD